MFHRRKKVLHVLKDTGVKKLWQNFHSWVNCPFKMVQFCSVFIIMTEWMHSVDTGCLENVSVFCNHGGIAFCSETQTLKAIPKIKHTCQPRGVFPISIPNHLFIILVIVIVFSIIQSQPHTWNLFGQVSMNLVW